MHELWKKMQVKNQTRFLVVAPPREIDTIIEGRDQSWELDVRPEIAASGDAKYEVVVMFLKNESDVVKAAEVTKAHVAGDDTLLWLCYPKKSSKKYDATINRDSGWDPVIDIGFEGVRQVAVDDDWSALRFRPREAIRTYTRKTQIGKS